jgi:hypothetical protein
MNNKNLMIGGVVLAGIVAYYFYNKNKGGDGRNLASSAPNNNTSPNVGHGGVPADAFNYSNSCEIKYSKYLSSLPPKLTKEYISPKEQQERKQNWMKNNCINDSFIAEKEIKEKLCEEKIEKVLATKTFISSDARYKFIQEFAKNNCGIKI